MILKDCKDAYYEYSRKTSEIVRYLGYAGLGFVWLFRKEINQVLVVPGELIFPSLLIIIGLILDLLHAVIGTLIWGIFHRRKEKSGIKKDESFLAPRWINWPANFLFWTKILIIMWAYILLIMFLCHQFIKLG